MSGLARRIASFGHAMRGLFVLIQQPNAQIHIGAACCVTVLGLGLGIGARDWAILVLCSSAVIATEAMNTAIERVVDLVSPEWHPLARDAKDLAAGAVLVTAIGAAFVGAMIFTPYLFG